MLIKLLQKGSQSIQLLANPVVNPLHLQKILTAKKFQQYVNKALAQSQVLFRSILIDSCFMFGPQVGFVNLINDCRFSQKKLPGYVFLRGHAVTVLMLINGKMLLVRQFRVPICEFLVEAPAGMLDEQGDFAGVVAKEIQEQTGLSIEFNKLKSIGSFYPSPGGCDQQLFMYLYEDQVDPSLISSLLQKEHGELDHGQSIQLLLWDFTLENVLKSRDGKLMALFCAYQNMKSK